MTPQLDSNTGYSIYMHNVGGKEPDGKPSRIGRWTFGTKMVRDVVLKWCDGRVLNACAGETHLSEYKKGVTFVRNDIDPDKDAKTHYDVRELADHYDSETFDAVVLDPPFDPGRADALYKGFHASGYIDARTNVGELVKRGGVVVELGWNSYSLADKDGWERVEHHLYRQPFKGDVHLTIDRKVNQKELAEFDP